MSWEIAKGDYARTTIGVAGSAGDAKLCAEKEKGWEVERKLTKHKIQSTR
jgi:hypothetical protein